jgi:glycosyltransferase involved in cell wall biosynthesis
VKPPDVFVAGLHLRWDGVWQRPHHLLSRLAQRLPVIVVEEPYGAAVDRDEVRTEGNLSVIRPLRRRGWGAPLVDAQALATARALIGARRCGAWLYTPMMSELIEACAAAPVVYDVMDDLANFDFAPAGMREREAALLERADVVFTGGRTLYENRRAYGAKVHCVPSGVELARFAADVGPHPLTAMLGGPVFAYVGVIDERLDYALIAALADAFPRGHVVLVGPVIKVDPALLPQRANVHFTGRLPYAWLPSLLAGVDVALMPFAINRATASISPTKTLEYFAARRPVVSTPVADVVAEYGEIVYVAAGAQAFIAAVREALAAPPERIACGVRAASARTWDAIFTQMWEAAAGTRTRQNPGSLRCRRD